MIQTSYLSHTYPPWDVLSSGVSPTALTTGACEYRRGYTERHSIELVNSGLDCWRSALLFVFAPYATQTMPGYYFLEKFLERELEIKLFLQKQSLTQLSLVMLRTKHKSKLYKIYHNNGQMLFCENMHKAEWQGLPKLWHKKTILVLNKL